MGLHIKSYVYTDCVTYTNTFSPKTKNSFNNSENELKKKRFPVVYIEKGSVICPNRFKSG